MLINYTIILLCMASENLVHSLNYPQSKKNLEFLIINNLTVK